MYECFISHSRDIAGGRPMAWILLINLLVFLYGLAPSSTASSSASTPTPSPWPLQFHSLLFINSTSGTLQATDLWFDWPNGRNFNIIHNQLSNVLHDLEWTNGTSFYYDLDAGTCKTIHFDVGILRPDWMVDNATYLGQETFDGFTCNVWSKADFIVYYEDVETNKPVHWIFYSGMSVHVMSFEVGAVLEDKHWQAPLYCFAQNTSSYGSNLLHNNVLGVEPFKRWPHGLGAGIQTSTFI